MYFSCKCNVSKILFVQKSYSEIGDEIKSMHACMHVTFSRARAHSL